MEELGMTRLLRVVLGCVIETDDAIMISCGIARCLYGDLPMCELCCESVLCEGILSELSQ